MAQIGIDIDGVIADTDTAFRKRMREVFKRDFPQDMMREFNYEDCFKFTEEEKKIFYSLFSDRHLWEGIEVICGARETLAKLKQRHSLIIITGRPVEVSDVTFAWLWDKRIPFDKLYFMEGKEKYEIAQLNGHKFSHFLEDHPDHALRMAQSGVKVLLMDYPWNQKIENHPGIERVKNWDEINKILKANKLL